ncbi:MAG: pyrroline-5-carboxylate reductase [Coriobacteriales bacterium]|jgi:pyrroline-5-carboxylate reductase|nr:pyrroline-5-carboxylate reductase [Coriobacteriales bacterium]
MSKTGLPDEVEGANEPRSANIRYDTNEPQDSIEPHSTAEHCELQPQSEVFARLGKLALVGGGKMGEAIIAGLVQGAGLDPSALEVAEPGEERRAWLSSSYGVTCVADAALITNAQTALFAVKPQAFRQVAAHLAAVASFAPERVISIAAGITTKVIAEFFPHAQIVRVMPNVPLVVSAGMSVVAVGAHTEKAEGELVVALFALMGEALLLPEDKLNAATALSGSGPAYFALLTEELARAGEHIGLSQEQAEQLALQTLIGTAQQLQRSKESPEELRRAVTSPGGTTQAALESFAAGGFAQIVEQAVKAAYHRAGELA